MGREGDAGTRRVLTPGRGQAGGSGHCPRGQAGSWVTHMAPLRPPLSLPMLHGDPQPWDRKGGRSLLLPREEVAVQAAVSSQLCPSGCVSAAWEQVLVLALLSHALLGSFAADIPAWEWARPSPPRRDSARRKLAAACGRAAGQEEPPCEVARAGDLHLPRSVVQKVGVQHAGPWPWITSPPSCSSRHHPILSASMGRVRVGSSS